MFGGHLLRWPLFFVQNSAHERTLEKLWPYSQIDLVQLSKAEFIFQNCTRITKNCAAGNVENVILVGTDMNCNMLRSLVQAVDH